VRQVAGSRVPFSFAPHAPGRFTLADLVSATGAVLSDPWWRVEGLEAR